MAGVNQIQAEAAQHGNPFVWIILIVLALTVIIAPFWLLSHFLRKRADVVEKRAAQKRWENIPNTKTEAQERTRIAMVEALNQAQQNKPHAAPPSLSTQLADLNEALQSGLITQEEYAKKRASIIA
jgi:cell division protein FtsL